MVLTNASTVGTSAASTLRLRLAHALWLAPLAPVAAAIGADLRAETHPVAGEVRFDGAVARGARVRLHPLNTSRWAYTTPSATVDEDGSFRIRTLGFRDGAAAGPYAVTVDVPLAADSEVGRRAGVGSLPVLYASPETTPLVVVVRKGRNQLRPLVLAKCRCTSCLEADAHSSVALGQDAS